jgi:tRNA (mo5U34)-methyltransferase
MAVNVRTAAELSEEIIHLGPWHYDVEVTPEISTRVHLDAPPGTYSQFAPIEFLEPRESFQTKMGAVYPDGLQGRSVMDCACNCGGYLFWAKEIGAGECFGFDARELWIKQARFLIENRVVSANEGMRFQLCDLYDLPKLRLAPFDITLFQGILYHLPDVLFGLKIAADLTRELLIVNTATWNNFPDGFLAVGDEGVKEPLSGVYAFNWYPTGPKVVARMLDWLGFPESRLVFWRRDTDQIPDDLGRLEVIAARERVTLEAWDRHHRNLPERTENLVTAN